MVRITRTEFKNRDERLYNFVRLNKKITFERLFPSQRKFKNGYWTIELCKKIAIRFKTKADWKRKHSNSYHVAIKQGWMSSCSKHMKMPNRWTKELCKTEALKYKTLSEWRQLSGGSYESARRYGWMDDCSKHLIITYKKWTKIECLKISSRYKSKKEWRNANPASYSYSYTHGWLDDCCKHMPVIWRRNCWNRKTIISAAKSFRTISEFNKKYPGAVSKARNLKIDFIKLGILQNGKFKSVIDLTNNRIFSSINMAAKDNNISCSNISSCLTGKTKTACGYRWAYYDEKKHAHLVKRKHK